jgi:hypothetical protein
MLQVLMNRSRSAKGMEQKAEKFVKQGAHVYRKA